MAKDMENKENTGHGITFMTYHTFYLCDKYKDCRNSPACGNECNFTMDKNHWVRGTMPIRKMSAPEIVRTIK